MSPFLDAEMLHEQVLPHLAQEIAFDGYISYHQALALGFVPTPQSLYTVIVTTIRDIHHPDAYNVAYLLGWLAAHYQREYHQSSIKQHLQMAEVHLGLTRSTGGAIMTSRHRYRQTGPSLLDTNKVSSPGTDFASLSAASDVAPDYRACVLVGHQWQSVSLDGRQQCQVCRIIAYCPSCTSTYPPTARLVFCSIHQEVTR